MLFLGAFAYALRELVRLTARRDLSHDPRMLRIHPYLLAATVGFAVGNLTVSFAYAVPTYTVLGLSTAFLKIALCAKPSYGLWEHGLFARWLGLGLLFLVGMHVFVRLNS